ncbi:MAG: CAP domain-containing protein [Suilimivivens sp.]
MRKTSLYAIATALTVATAAAPLSVKASESSSLADKLQRDGYAVIVGNAGNCEELKDIFSQIEEELGKLNFGSCVPGINIPGGNAPQLPETGTPETPDMENPDIPEASNPSIPEAGKPDVPGTDNSEEAVEESLAHQVVRLVNEERAKAGLPALTIDVNTEAAALVRAKEIKQSFSHTRPNGSQFATALKEQGVSYRGAGENIAYGQKSPEAVMQAWMNSEGHRANILNPKYTKIGVGHYQDANGTNYWTQLFIY